MPGFLADTARGPAGLSAHTVSVPCAVASMRHLPVTNLSNSGVPGIASLWRRGAQTFTESFQTVGDRQVGDVFHALVAELAWETQAKRSAVAHGKFTAIHSIGEKSLRM